MNDVSFASLGLAEPLLRAISETGYTAPTPIQVQAIPMVMQGGDLLAAAQTGTGKTAGFALPLLHRLAASPAVELPPGHPRCLILAPTRELAAQVEQAVQVYGKHLPLTSMAIFGGVPIAPQVKRLNAPLDVLVATPGRLLDHAGQGTLNLSRVEILVLDEADRMLDMGFIRDIRKILALLPPQRQNLLFSATFSEEIRELAGGLLQDPGCVEAHLRNTASGLVQQSLYHIGQRHKRELLAHLIKQNQWFQVLVFTRTKHGANRLAEYLCRQQVSALAIHGNKSQTARTRALGQFKDCELQVLVATDIAARGLDIDQLPHVVNFDLPNVAEDYVHRIGRTGRAGSEGEAISLVDVEELKYLAAIEKLIRFKITERELPTDFEPTSDPTEPAQEPGPPRDGRPAAAGQPRAAGQGTPRGNRNGGRRKGARGGSGHPPADPRAGRETDGNRLPAEERDESEEELNFNRWDIDPTGRRVTERPEVDGNRMPPRESRKGNNDRQRRGNGPKEQAPRQPGSGRSARRRKPPRAAAPGGRSGGREG